MYWYRLGDTKVYKLKTLGVYINTITKEVRINTRLLGLPRATLIYNYTDADTNTMSDVLNAINDWKK